MLKIKLGTEEKVFEGNELNELNQSLNIIPLGDQRYNFQVKNRNYEVSILDIDRAKKSIYIELNGKTATMVLEDQMDMLLSKMGIDLTANQKMTHLKAPMPGLILEWFVSEGQEIQEGDNLLVLEAMKMENVIKSTGYGVVKKINAQKGEAIEKNQILMELE